jgi:hypothetical protein
MLTGELDTTYLTMQRDLFTGGLIGKIGPHAFVIWTAICGGLQSKHPGTALTAPLGPNSLRAADRPGPHCVRLRLH